MTTPARSRVGTFDWEYGWACPECQAWAMPVDPDDPLGVAVRAARAHARDSGHTVALVKVSMLVWPDPR